MNFLLCLCMVVTGAVALTTAAYFWFVFVCWLFPRLTELEEQAAAALGLAAIVLALIGVAWAIHVNTDPWPTEHTHAEHGP